MNLVPHAPVTLNDMLRFAQAMGNENVELDVDTLALICAGVARNDPLTKEILVAMPGLSFEADILPQALLKAYTKSTDAYENIGTFLSILHENARRLDREVEAVFSNELPNSQKKMYGVSHWLEYYTDGRRDVMARVMEIEQRCGTSQLSADSPECDMLLTSCLIGLERNYLDLAQRSWNLLPETDRYKLLFTGVMRHYGMGMSDTKVLLDALSEKKQTDWILEQYTQHIDTLKGWNDKSLLYSTMCGWAQLGKSDIFLGVYNALPASEKEDMLLETDLFLSVCASGNYALMEVLYNDLRILDEDLQNVSAKGDIVTTKLVSGFNKAVANQNVDIALRIFSNEKDRPSIVKGFGYLTKEDMAFMKDDRLYKAYCNSLSKEDISKGGIVDLACLGDITLLQETLSQFDTAEQNALINTFKQKMLEGALKHARKDVAEWIFKEKLYLQELSEPIYQVLHYIDSPDTDMQQRWGDDAARLELLTCLSNDYPIDFIVALSDEKMHLFDNPDAIFARPRRHEWLKSILSHYEAKEQYMDSVQGLLDKIDVQSEEAYLKECGSYTELIFCDNDFALFRQACSRDLSVAQDIYTLIPESLRSACLVAKDYDAFQEACRTEPEVAKWLIDMMGAEHHDALKDIIQKRPCNVLVKRQLDGHLEQKTSTILKFNSTIKAL